MRSAEIAANLNLIRKSLSTIVDANANTSVPAPSYAPSAVGQSSVARQAPTHNDGILNSRFGLSLQDEALWWKPWLSGHADSAMNVSFDFNALQSSIGNFAMLGGETFIPTVHTRVIAPGKLRDRKSQQWLSASLHTSHEVQNRVVMRQNTMTTGSTPEHSSSPPPFVEEGYTPSKAREELRSASQVLERLNETVY
ncbi:hypothetical protein FISHEDRAFT_69884 [Fistulina hepatica ATCC 64428]|uniref:Uncharacterized protein n=1 Tax=Fistulina hepatica ATCC 64428 TaxID=1128425 RepID=A0A0D7AL34_9AGAR|nr:hypothetical protein FISHEDRAFT_69884 [Fistulina hepatica ATCC 64428]